MKLIPKLKTKLLSDLAQREWKVALYSDKVQRAFYTTKGEVEGTGYKAGGKAFPERSVDDSDIYVDGSVVWDNASIEAVAALIYDAKTGEGLFFEVFEQPIRSIRDEFRLDFPDVVFSMT